MAARAVRRGTARSARSGLAGASDPDRKAPASRAGIVRGCPFPQSDTERIADLCADSRLHEGGIRRIAAIKRQRVRKTAMKSPRSKLVFLLLAMLASSMASAGNRPPSAPPATPAPPPQSQPTSAPGGGGMSQLPNDFCNPASGYQNPLPPSMCFHLNVPYGADPLQKIDVYMPATATHNAPVIVMVHGGAWYQGDKFDNSVVRNKAMKWVPPGAIFISVNYPLVPKVTPVQQARSVGLAMAYAQRHAAEWGGDPDKFILMGFSAGGHLVSLLATQPSLQQSNSQKVRPWLGTIALDAAVYDVPAYMNNPGHDPIFDQAFGTDPKLWSAASPMTQMRTRIAPFLAVCSTEESGSCTRAQAFVDKALGYGTDALVIDENLDHEHINANLGLSSNYTTDVNSFMNGLVSGTLR